MLCPKCGRMLPDGVPCPCGAPLRSTNPAVNLIKTLGVSAKLLAAAVLYSAVVFLGLLSLLGVGAVTSPLYYIGASGAITPEDFEELVRAMDQATGLSGILFAAPAALSAAALWLFYAACRNRKTGNVSTAGLTIFQVMAYIQLAFYCLLAFLLLVLGIFSVVSSSSMPEIPYYVNGENYGAAPLQMVIGMLVLLILMMGGFCALWIAFAVCAVKTLNRIKATAATGVPDNRVPGLLTGFMIVIAVFGILYGMMFCMMFPVLGLQMLCSAVAMILLSRLLSEYRRKMTFLCYPPVFPAYPVGPVPPHPPVPPQYPSGPKPR